MPSPGNPPGGWPVPDDPVYYDPTYVPPGKSPSNREQVAQVLATVSLSLTAAPLAALLLILIFYGVAPLIPVWIWIPVILVLYWSFRALPLAVLPLLIAIGLSILQRRTAPFSDPKHVKKLVLKTTFAVVVGSGSAMFQLFWR